MRVFALYIILAIFAYFIIKKFMQRQVYVKYMQSIGIPTAIIMQMSLKELKIAFNYLKEYARTGLHFNIDHPDYSVLADMRTRYGIFT